MPFKTGMPLSFSAKSVQYIPLWKICEALSCRKRLLLRRDHGEA